MKNYPENEIPDGDVNLSQNRDNDCRCVNGWNGTDCLSDIDECYSGRKDVGIFNIYDDKKLIGILERKKNDAHLH